MNKNRVNTHPVLGSLVEKKQVTFTFNDKEYQGFENEPIAAALLAQGVRTLRYHEASAKPRGIYCNIGHCFECRVIVNGKIGQRACLTPLQDQMVIESHGQLPNPVKEWSEKNV